MARSFTLRKTLPIDEHIYGLGDKTGPLDRRGDTLRRLEHRRVRVRSATDPIYKSIPFFIGTGGAGGSYGLFLDNTWRTWFDFGHRDAERIEIGAPDGPIDYYLIAGPTVRRRRAPLYRPDRQAAAAAAVGARLPAVALELHERRRGARRSPRACAPTASRPT